MTSRRTGSSDPTSSPPVSRADRCRQESRKEVFQTSWLQCFSSTRITGRCHPSLWKTSLSRIVQPCSESPSCRLDCKTRPCRSSRPDSIFRTGGDGSEHIESADRGTAEPCLRPALLLSTSRYQTTAGFIADHQKPLQSRGPAGRKVYCHRCDSRATDGTTLFLEHHLRLPSCCEGQSSTCWQSDPRTLCCPAVDQSGDHVLSADVSARNTRKSSSLATYRKCRVRRDAGTSHRRKPQTPEFQLLQLSKHSGVNQIGWFWHL